MFWCVRDVPDCGEDSPDCPPWPQESPCQPGVWRSARSCAGAARPTPAGASPSPPRALATSATALATATCLTLETPTWGAGTWTLITTVMSSSWHPELAQGDRVRPRDSYVSNKISIFRLFISFHCFTTVFNVFLETPSMFTLLTTSITFG